MKKQLIENWLRDNFKPKLAVDSLWNKTALCDPRIIENPFLKTNKGIKVKIDGAVFVYVVYNSMPQTKTYDVVYKIMSR